MSDCTKEMIMKNIFRELQRDLDYLFGDKYIITRNATYDAHASSEANIPTIYLLEGASEIDYSQSDNAVLYKFPLNIIARIAYPESQTAENSTLAGLSNELENVLLQKYSDYHPYFAEDKIHINSKIISNERELGSDAVYVILSLDIFFYIV